LELQVFLFTQMSPEFQQYAAFTIVAAAAGSLLWRLARPWFGRGESHDCGSGCGKCPANQGAAVTELGQPLVQLQPLGKKRSVN
jgi:hypothetical protein